MKRSSRWNLLHVASSVMARPPEMHTIQLSFTPGHDTVAYSSPAFLVLMMVGGKTHKPDLIGVDPLSGDVLWRFSEEIGDTLFVTSHVDPQNRIIATGPDGVYHLSRDGIIPLLKRKLSPVSTARFSPKDGTGYVLDDDNCLVAFSPEGKILWTKKPRKRKRFQNPFPLEDGSVCLSSTEDIVCLSETGERAWSWTGSRDNSSSYQIASYVRPNTILITANENGQMENLILSAKDGSFQDSLDKLWPFSSDGVSDFPVLLLAPDGKNIAFLKKDGEVTEPTQIRSSLKRRFCELPEGHVAIFYDAWMKTIVCADDKGKVCWRENYPDVKKGLAALSFMKDIAFFVTPAGNLHVWDWGG